MATPDNEWADPMGSAGCKGRILYVEDEKINQLSLKRYLDRQGFEVVCANNGIEAIRLLEALPFDVVLMDIRMPVMDGDEATRTIRASATPYRDIPIIAVTAHDIAESRERCRAIGMNGFISKPLDLRSLCEVLPSYILAKD